YPEVATKSRFRQEKRAKLFSSLIFGAVFLIIYIIFKGFPSSGKEIFDIIMRAVFATFFFFLFQYISLKKSYKKNKELLDDCFFSEKECYICKTLKINDYHLKTYMHTHTVNSDT